MPSLCEDRGLFAVGAAPLDAEYVPGIEPTVDRADLLGLAREVSKRPPPEHRNRREFFGGHGALPRVDHDIEPERLDMMPPVRWDVERLPGSQHRDAELLRGLSDARELREVR